MPPMSGCHTAFIDAFQPRRLFFFVMPAATLIRFGCCQPYVSSKALIFRYFFAMFILRYCLRLLFSLSPDIFITFTPFAMLSLRHFRFFFTLLPYFSPSFSLHFAIIIRLLLIFRQHWLFSPFHFRRFISALIRLLLTPAYFRH